MLDMQPLLDRRTEGFSQGERMKTALARALVHDPHNIILDEPTNGLDVLATRALREALRRLRDEQGKCIVFSTHIMQEVERLCDQVVVMAHGRAVAAGHGGRAVRADRRRPTSRRRFVQLAFGADATAAAAPHDRRRLDRLPQGAARRAARPAHAADGAAQLGGHRARWCWCCCRTLVAGIEERAEAREIVVAGIEHAPTLRNYLERQTYRVRAGAGRTTSSSCRTSSSASRCW